MALKVKELIDFHQPNILFYRIGLGDEFHEWKYGSHTNYFKENCYQNGNEKPDEFQFFFPTEYIYYLSDDMVC